LVWLLRPVVAAVGLLIGSGIAAPRAAAADAPAAAAADAQKVSAGAEAIRKGDFSTALRLFNEAYAISQNPKLHYNIAVAYEGLGRITAAYEEFGRFLAEAVNVPAEFRAEAQRRKDKLRVKLASVRLADAPAGATVSIDGQPRGRTPIVEELVVAAGTHTITIERPGAVAISKSFDAPAGATVDVSAAPAPPAVAAAPPPAPMTAPAPVSGSAAVVVATAPAAATRAGEGPVRLGLGVGVGSWVSGAPGRSPASVALSLEGTARAVRFGQSTTLHLGAKLGWAPLPDNGSSDSFFAAMAEGRLESLLGGDRMLMFASLAAGPLVISGLSADSSLLRAGVTAQEVGTLYTIEVAPSVGLEFALSDATALFAALSGSLAPLKSEWFSDSLAARFELGAGFAVRL
jgi:hypothetical protein